MYSVSGLINIEDYPYKPIFMSAIMRMAISLNIV